MNRVWPGRFGSIARVEAVFESNAQIAETIVGEVLAEASVKGFASLPLTISAQVDVEGNSVGFPGYAFGNDTMTLVIEAGLSLSKGGSAIFPFEFDRGIDDQEALVQSLNDAGYEGGGGGADDAFALLLTDGDDDISGGAVDLTGLSSGEATVEINRTMALLIPAKPPQFPNGTLSISNTAGSSPRLATGFTDNIASGLTAGASVTRITDAGVSTFAFSDVGPGKNGTISATLNGALAASVTLTGIADNGNYSGLVIADQKDYPADKPGFWKSIDVNLSSLPVPIGVDKIKMAHTAAGETNEVVFIRDPFTASPGVSASSVIETTAGAYAYSSSVPHYGTGGVLTVAASISNLAGETYYGGSDPFTVTGTNGIIASKTFTYGDLGITTPIARNTTAAQAISPRTVAVDGTNVHGVGVLQGTAKNVNGSGAATLSTTNILVKRGTATGKLDEMAISVSGMGSTPNGNNAVRVSLGAGDTPAGAAGAWDQTAALPTYESACVAGKWGHNAVNYATGYLPIGPNLSVGRGGAQYGTVSFNRASRSTFKITLTGSYAGCWIKLPGVSDTQPNAPNGWWNAFQAYDGAGVPGEAGDPNAGCALGAVMNGGSGTFTITFGTESSTNATGNQILIRFKFNAGQELTALQFTN